MVAGPVRRFVVRQVLSPARVAAAQFGEERVSVRLEDGVRHLCSLVCVQVLDDHLRLVDQDAHPSLEDALELRLRPATDRHLETVGVA